jgi:hypothetical protein
MKSWLIVPVLFFVDIISPAKALSAIPFVGCSGATATGEVLGPPISKPLETDIPANIASHLAIYVSDDMAVLGPRGWDCFLLVGNSSMELDVVPPGILPADPTKVMPNPMNTSYANAGIMASEWNLGGNYDALGGYFPKLCVRYQNNSCEPNIFVQPMPRYPADTIVAKNESVVEYETPPGHQGLGYGSWDGDDTAATPPNLPTYGLLAFDPDGPADAGGIIFLAVRLPKGIEDLHTTIIAHFEECVPETQTVQCESEGAFLKAGAQTSVN